ncbi:hypothetical protein G9A89_010636 [Geosiphon pyriformis]|nr:hypothetical protein G9A89_010636 [Geosiphon pyriformis]
MLLLDIDLGVSKLQGGRREQMDEFDITHNYFKEKGYALFLIYDGHGDNRFSKHAKKNLANFIVNDPDFIKGNYANAFRHGFQKEDAALMESFGLTKKGGTTVTAALLLKNEAKCYIANVGDSNAVLGKKNDISLEANLANVEDKVYRKEERRRLEKAGTNISGGRLVRHRHSVNMTRALGDFDFKAPQTETGQDWISPVPHVRVINLVPEDKFLILASDGSIGYVYGLWNFFDQNSVVATVADEIDLGYNVQQIAQELAVTVVEENKKFSDNITVVLVSFIWENE